MAREVIFRDWCDPCLDHDDVREPATHKTPPVTLNGKPYVMDVCDRHHKEMVQPLADALAALGRAVEDETPGKRATNAGRKYFKPAVGIRCQVPGCTQRPSGANSRKAFGQHLYGRHAGTEVGTLSGYEAVYGPVRDPERTGQGESPTPQAEPASEAEHGTLVPLVDALAALGNGDDNPNFECRIDGCTTAYPPDQYARPAQALGVHRRQVHGVRGR